MTKWTLLAGARREVATRRIHSINTENGHGPVTPCFMLDSVPLVFCCQKLQNAVAQWSEFRHREKVVLSTNRTGLFDCNIQKSDYDIRKFDCAISLMFRSLTVGSQFDSDCLTVAFISLTVWEVNLTMIRVCLTAIFKSLFDHDISLIMIFRSLTIILRNLFDYQKYIQIWLW